jgi:hypothetical protein
VPVETTVDIATDWLAREPSLPDRCVLHGLPAARRVDLAVRSRPKIGSRKRVFLPGYTSLDRASEYVRQVQVVKVTGWPMCARCVRRHTIGLGLASVLFFGGLAAVVTAFIIGAVAQGPMLALMVPILGGFATMLVSPLALRWGSLVRLSRAEVTPDGAAVHVADAHPQFVGQLSQAS